MGGGGGGGGVQVRAPHQTYVWKISRLCGPISSLALDVSEKGYGQSTL